MSIRALNGYISIYRVTEKTQSGIELKFLERIHMTSRESEVMTMTLKFDLNEIDTFVKSS